MMMPAILHTLATVAAFATRRYPAFAFSLAAWAPVVWTWNPDSDPWRWHIWLPCVVAFSAAQGMGAVEALFRFGEKFPLSVQLSGMLVFFAIAGGWCFWKTPHGTTIDQVTEFTTITRHALSPSPPPPPARGSRHQHPTLDQWAR